MKPLFPAALAAMCLTAMQALPAAAQSLDTPTVEGRGASTIQSEDATAVVGSEGSVGATTTPATQLNTTNGQGSSDDEEGEDSALNGSETDTLQSPMAAWIGANWLALLVGGLVLVVQVSVLLFLLSQRRLLAMIGSPRALTDRFAQQQLLDIRARREGLYDQTQALSRKSATTLVDVLVAMHRDIEGLKAEVARLGGGATGESVPPSSRSTLLESSKRTAFDDHPAPAQPEPVEPTFAARRSRDRGDYGERSYERNQHDLRAVTTAFDAAMRSRRSLLRFAEERSARYISEGRAVDDGSSAMLIALPLTGEDYAILPGPELASNFANMYDSERSMPEDARLAFDFVADGSRDPKIDSAAIGRFQDGALVIIDKGLLVGLRD